jgi:tetratricopeptide (TPR) repeat protein
MRTVGRLIIIMVAAVAFFSLIASSACGPSTSSVQEVSINVAPEEQKTIYVDNFVNLSGNADYNLLEESIPEMLLTTLDGLRTIKIIQRDKLQKYLAVKSEQNGSVSLLEAARSLGADFLIDGWIDGTSDGKYRIYANLLNLANNKLRERFAAVDFTDKEEALQAVANLITEVQDTLSLSREELDKAEAKFVSDYEVHRQFLKAWQSYLRGKPEVAAALFEKAIQMADQQRKRALEAGRSVNEDDPTLYFHFIVAQIYNELGDEHRALEHLQPVYDKREAFSGKEDIRKFIEALWTELHGDYPKARRLYTEIKDSQRFEREYYLRMAHLALKEGKSPEKALNIVDRGAKRFPDDIQLLKRRADLEFLIQGDKAVERYAAQAAEKKDDPVSSEVASKLVNEKLIGDSLKEISRTLPAVSVTTTSETSKAQKSGESTFSFSVGGVNLNLKLDEFKKECEIDCQTTLDNAAMLATLAAEEGNTEIALQIADMISAKVTIAKAVDVDNRIRALVAVSQGDYIEAEKLARRIPESDPNRFITLGSIYIYLGKPDEAAAELEKAISLGGEINPIIYYTVANANLLAGNYKKWDYYTKLFLEKTSKNKKADKDTGTKQ